MLTRPDDAQFLDELVRSYERATGLPFPGRSSPGPSLREQLDTASFGLLAHDASEDPRFVYANTAAALAFGYPLDELVGMPSRLSAAQGPDRRERSRLFSELERSGFSSGYRGRRVRKDGSTFWIEDATIWNIDDADGHRLGQAALILGFA